MQRRTLNATIVLLVALIGLLGLFVMLQHLEDAVDPKNPPLSQRGTSSASQANIPVPVTINVGKSVQQGTVAFGVSQSPKNPQKISSSATGGLRVSLKHVPAYREMPPYSDPQSATQAVTEHLFMERVLALTSATSANQAGTEPLRAIEQTSNALAMTLDGVPFGFTADPEKPSARNFILANLSGADYVLSIKKEDCEKILIDGVHPKEPLLQVREGMVLEILKKLDVSIRPGKVSPDGQLVVQ